ncbi:zinc finger protein PLAGL2-like [Eucyclogobius newberryi]|uniref:zinc finger protein PLAGL2-like n=1 Tax=Eucyclogobius newberryi TaxID=166745 RepID=UPI003B597341
MFNPQSHLRGLSEERPPEEGRQRFHCQECGKQYNTQLGFRRHLVAAHSTAGAPLCPQTPPSLLEQLGSHTDRPPPPEGAVVVPVRERKYSCERCDRRFYTRKDVRRHAVVHTGRRDFLCPRCAQRFGRRDHLTRHLKKSHAQEPPPPAAPVTPVATPTSAQCPVKEEPSPRNCDMGSLPKEPLETFCRDMYSSYPMPPHSLTQGPLPSGMSRHVSSQGAALPQQPYSSVGRYQHSSTSYPRSEVDSFLLELQSAGPPHHSMGAGCSSPQRETLAEGSELSCTTNLLGFLPFGLPPYSAHMGMGGLVMNYPPTSASSPSSSAGLTSQAPGPFFLQSSQTQVSPAAGSHNHNQLPQAYGGSGPSGALPHYYQAFQ